MKLSLAGTQGNVYIHISRARPQHVKHTALAKEHEAMPTQIK